MSFLIGMVVLVFLVAGLFYSGLILVSMLDKNEKITGWETAFLWEDVKKFIEPENRKMGYFLYRIRNWSFLVFVVLWLVGFLAGF